MYVYKSKRRESRCRKFLGIATEILMIIFYLIVAVISVWNFVEIQNLKAEVPSAQRDVPLVDTNNLPAHYAAQERYYEVVDLYGDVEGAVEAARVVWSLEMQD